jgi:hypothetical protein
LEENPLAYSSTTPTQPTIRLGEKILPPKNLEENPLAFSITTPHPTNNPTWRKKLASKKLGGKSSSI